MQPPLTFGPMMCDISCEVGTNQNWLSLKWDRHTGPMPRQHDALVKKNPRHNHDSQLQQFKCERNTMYRAISTTVRWRDPSAIITGRTENHG